MVDDQGSFDPTPTSGTHRQRILAIDRLCTEFEREWLPGNQAGINEFIQDAEPSLRSDLVTELIAIECELRDREHDPPRISDYHESLSKWTVEVEKGFNIWSNLATGIELEGAVAHQDLKQLGEYRLIRQIGQGGMGVIYEAVQESLGRRVAIKTLTQTNVLSLVTRFKREARAVARLHHTNIVEVFGSGVDNGVPYIAMQLIAGRGLNSIIKEASEAAAAGESHHQLAGSDGYRLIARIGMEVAEALDHAHQQGVLHRDVKPANLLIDEKGDAFVTDFGLAKLTGDDSDATLAGSIIGTLRYLPPETFRGLWDERVDVYALGVTLYEALALRPAFGASEQRQLIDCVTRGEPDTPLRSLNQRIPLDLETIVTKAMSPEPKSRYQTADLLAGDLRRFLDGEPIHARPARMIEKTWKWSKRQPVIASLLAMILLVLSIGLPTMTVLWRRAEMARANAETQQELANASERDAKAAALEAQVAEAEALQQKSLADSAKEANAAARYGSAMMLAQKYMEEGDTYSLGRLLNEWVPDPDDNAVTDRRGWEWDYLNENTNASVLSVRGKFPFAWDVAVSPDDTQIAAAFGRLVNGWQNQVVVWGSVAGDVLYELNDPNCNIDGLAYSPDGALIATIGHVIKQKETRGTLTLWDASNGKKRRSVKLPGPYNKRYISGGLTFNYPSSVAFSADGKQLLVTPNPIELYDTETLKPVWEGKSIEGDEAVFGKDGQIVSHGDTEIHVYDQASGESLYSKEHADLFGCLRCSDDRAVFTSMTKDTVRVFADSSWSEHRDVSSVGVSWGSVSPDGQWVLTGSRAGALTIRPLADRSQPPIGFLGHTSEISDAAFSHDGKWFVTSSLDGSVKKWSMQSVLGSTVLGTQLFSVSEIAFRGNGRTVVCAGRAVVGATSASAVPIFGEPPVAQAVRTTVSETWPRTDFAFSRDGTLLAAPYKEEKIPTGTSEAYSGKIGIWSTSDWQELGQIELGMPVITSVLWMDGTRMVAVAGYTRADRASGRPKSFSVKIFRVNSSEFKADLVADIPSAFRAVSLAFRGGLLAVGGKGISIWNLNGVSDGGSVEFTKASEITHHNSAIYMDFSPDSNRLAVAHYAGGNFRVIDVATGQSIYERQGPRNGRCIQFSPDGQRLAVVGHDAHVHYCDAETGTQLLNLAGSRIPAGTAGLDARVIFSPDGKRIATHNLQGQIRIWEVEDNASQSARDTH